MLSGEATRIAPEELFLRTIRFGVSFVTNF